MTTSIKTIMNASPVIPVMVIHRVEHAVPLAQALVQGGLKVLEITLRTPVAAEAIKQIKTSVPGAIVGAGTVINQETLNQAVKAGAEFLVSPGVTDDLLHKALSSRVPLLPGVISPSEVMRLAFVPPAAQDHRREHAADDGGDHRHDESDTQRFHAFSLQSSVTSKSPRR